MDFVFTTWKLFKVTLLRTNISHPKAPLKMLFPFPRWDMVAPWRVRIVTLHCPLCGIISWCFESTKKPVVLRWRYSCNFKLITRTSSLGKCYARFAYFMLYVLCINVPCMMSIAPIRVDLPTPQTNAKHNKRITGRCHWTIISSFNMAGYSFQKALLERSRRIGWGLRCFTNLPLHMKPKDYRQLLKLEALMGRGEGETKSGKARCSPMLVCQLWRIPLVTIVLASTWIVTLDSSTFRLESRCIYFPKRSFQYYGSWGNIFFVTSVHLTQTQTISLWSSQAISAVQSLNNFFVVPLDLLYEKQINPLAPLIFCLGASLFNKINRGASSVQRPSEPGWDHSTERQFLHVFGLRSGFETGWGNGIIVWLPKPGVKGEEVEGLSLWVFEGFCLGCFFFGGVEFTYQFCFGITICFVSNCKTYFFWIPSGIMECN